MSQLMITGGWVLNVMGTLWIVLILLYLILQWLPQKRSGAGFLQEGLQKITAPAVNLLRRTLPTVYRGMDFAPWLTILILVLMKTFIFRSMIYWGMLHQPPGG